MAEGVGAAAVASRGATRCRDRPCRVAVCPGLRTAGLGTTSKAADHYGAGRRMTEYPNRTTLDPRSQLPSQAGARSSTRRPKVRPRR